MRSRIGRARLSGFNVNEMPLPWLHALVEDHLVAKEWLSLFLVSKGTAAVVLRHAPSIELLLKHRGSATARELCAQRYAIEAILAAAPGAELKVCLIGHSAGGVHNASGLPSLWSGSIRQQARQLTLKNVDITEDMLQNQLQLQQCHQLHTLVLADTCQSWMSSQQLLKLSAQRASIFPPSLTNLQEAAKKPGASADIARIIGPQLTHLQCVHSLHKYPTGMLSQLTHISLSYLFDEAMDQLMKLPRLTHVTAGWVLLQQSYINKQLRWHQLKISDAVNISRLLPLPLPHIQNMVLHSGITFSHADADTMQQATAHLASCPTLQCVPTTEGEHLPGFSQFCIMTQHPSELVSLCANSMTVSGSLCLWDVTFTALQQLLPCIRSLPPKVSMLHLMISSTSADMQLQQQVQLLQQVAGALPPHVKHLAVEPPVNNKHTMCTYAQAIISYIEGNQKPFRLIITFWPSDEVPAELQALAKAHPGHLRCLHMKE